MRKIVMVMGIVAFILFGCYTNWQAALALFVAMWSDNVAQNKRA